MKKLLQRYAFSSHKPYESNGKFALPHFGRGDAALYRPYARTLRGLPSHFSRCKPALQRRFSHTLGDISPHFGGHKPTLWGRYVQEEASIAFLDSPCVIEVLFLLVLWHIYTSILPYSCWYTSLIVYRDWLDKIKPDFSGKPGLII